MKQLINIKEVEGKQVVSARELYKWLGLDISQWARWYKKNITNNQFAIENQDYQQLDIMSRKSLDMSSKTKDFALTIDFAKKLAMLSRTEKGEQARTYFVEVEKKFLQAKEAIDELDVMEAVIKRLREQRQRLDKVETDVEQLKIQTATRPDYFTIAGYCRYIGTTVNLTTAASLGRKASALCKKRQLPTDSTVDPRFGSVKMYPSEVLQEVFSIHKV